MIVEYETDGRVAVITLNRPEARNAVSGELAQALEEVGVVEHMPKLEGKKMIMIIAPKKK